MLDDYLNSLNPRQREAAELGCESALVLAGAGSGKTKVLTTRIALLLSRAMARPAQILAVTFTNKAAREMRERLSTMVSCDLKHLWMGTFHGTAHRILRAHAEAANLPPTFQIIDTSDQLSIIRRIMKEAGIDPKMRDPKSVQWAINSYKEKGLRADAVSAHEADEGKVTLYKTYETRCQREGLVDFAELMLRCVELLEGNQLVREHYNDRFKYLLVDEFQDTDSLQFRFIQALCPPKKADSCVFCVGDDDQSIYAFRGAKVGNMADFVKAYGVKKIIKLEQNYRSTSHILDGANAVISNNADRMGKNLWTDAGAGEPIRLFQADADLEEARAVVQDILAEKRRGRKFSDFAILYRNNSLSRNFERFLSTSGVPYRVYGGLRFFDRQEVKDVVAYLRVLANGDDTSLLRVINQPPRGIGATTVDRATAMAAEQGVTIWEILAESDSVPEIRRAGAFVALMEKIGEEAEGKSLPQLIELVSKLSGLEEFYQKQQDADIRLENLGELVNAAVGYCEENGIEEDAPALDPVPGGSMSPLDGFLSQAALEPDDKNAEEEPDAVRLMTVHASKGLEFPYVYLTGLEQDLFPHYMREDENPDFQLSEERRLMYVAMTRARRNLWISWARQRMLWGQSRDQLRSQFVDEIPEEHVVRLYDENADNEDDDFDQSWGSRGGWGSRSQGWGSKQRSGGSYGSSYGGSASYGGGRSSSYSSSGRSSSYSRAPSGSAARDFGSNGWKQAGLMKASELLARKKTVSAGGFSVGDTIEHPTLGRGKVLAITYPEKPAETNIEIEFAGRGRKNLKLMFVQDKLKKVG